MDKNVILTAFSLPILIAILGIIKGVTATEGWGAIAGGIIIMFAIIAALMAGISLFLVRKRKLTWWHGFVISIGSFVVALLILLVYAYVQDM